MQNKSNSKGKAKNIATKIRGMKLGTIYAVDFYDIKCEIGASHSVLTDTENNMPHIRAIGKLVKITDLQISLSAFYDLDDDEKDDEDFVHIPIGCIYNRTEMRFDKI